MKYLFTLFTCILFLITSCKKNSNNKVESLNNDSSLKVKPVKEVFNTVNIDQEKKTLEAKGLKIVEEVKGYYDNDNITDLVWVICKITRPEGTGYSKMEYWLQVFLGASSANNKDYRSLFKSDKVIPCTFCEPWQNKSDYSYYDIKIENQKFSFFTNQLVEDINEKATSWDIKFVFSYKNDKMLLNKVEKKIIYFKEYKKIKEEQQTINISDKINLQGFNIYNWKYVNPEYISG